MTCYWLIEVVYDPNPDGRATKYFNGRTEPRWEGCTTMDTWQAQRYVHKEEAEADMARLARRVLGEWRVIEHSFGE